MDPRQRRRTPFLKKPMEVVLAEEAGDKLARYLGLLDLLAIGIGGTVGSGIFVLAGAIAYDETLPAGPSVALSFLMAGVGCVLSGLSFSEMASRIPSAGSTYAYAYVTLGEVMAFIAGWCLTLENGVSAAAVARSWGDKVETYLIGNGFSAWDHRLRVGSTINLWAGLLTLACVMVLLKGLNAGKVTTNLFTAAKVCLVGFMVALGLVFFHQPYLRPLAPSGVKGVLQGALKCFFGFIGYDGVTCMCASAKDPHRDIPLAVMGTVVGVTVLYILASLALVGMQPFEEAITHVENRESPFAYAFRYHGAEWAYQIVSIGELVTLPVAVLIGLTIQPRLQFAMAEDGLLPKVFSEVDSDGNLFKSTCITGAACVVIALVVPFNLLDDMTSAGLLIAFNLTNSGLILVRRRRPTCPSLINWLVMMLNLLALITTYLWAHTAPEDLMVSKNMCLALCLVPVLLIEMYCPEIPTSYKGFRTPLVPWLPSLAVVINWFLLAQLSWQGIWMIGVYIGLALITYFLYGYWRSVGAQNGWQAVLARAGRKSFMEEGLKEMVVDEYVYLPLDAGGVEHEEEWKYDSTDSDIAT